MVTELGENVWWVDLAGVNAYLVDDEGTLTLVDTGFPWHKRRIPRAVVEAGYAVVDIERVLVTHYDIDHVGALGSIEGLDATIYVGHEDWPALARDELPPLSNHKGLFQRAFDWWRTVPDLPVETVEDGDTVGSFTAYHAPGHTPGHTVFASEELDVAFLGDVVRESSGQFEPSPWLICTDHDENQRSLSMLADRLPAVAMACPGHGVPFTEHGTDRVVACAERSG